LVAEHRTAQGIQRKPSYYPAKDTQEIRRGLFHVDNGLFVFTPTATEFKAFANFLQQAEEIAGRENGVVKVIVPREW